MRSLLLALMTNMLVWSLFASIASRERSSSNCVSSSPVVCELDGVSVAPFVRLRGGRRRVQTREAVDDNVQRS